MARVVNGSNERGMAAGNFTHDVERAFRGGRRELIQQPAGRGFHSARVFGFRVGGDFQAHGGFNAKMFLDIEAGDGGPGRRIRQRRHEVSRSARVVLPISLVQSSRSGAVEECKPLDTGAPGWSLSAGIICPDSRRKIPANSRFKSLAIRSLCAIAALRSFYSGSAPGLLFEWDEIGEFGLTEWVPIRFANTSR